MPDSILRHGRPHFLEQWQPRQRCGQWRPETFHRLYDLATVSIGLQDSARLDEFEIKRLADDLADALTKQQLWLDKALALLVYRADYQLLLQLPRIGKPTAAAILTAIGDIHQYTNGKQLVKLAGLDILYTKAVQVSENSPKFHTSAVPTSGTGSITTLCGSSRMRPIFRAITYVASTKLLAKAQDNAP